MTKIILKVGIATKIGKLRALITTCSSFKLIHSLFFELSCAQTDRHTDTNTHTQTDRHEYSIVAVDNNFQVQKSVTYSNKYGRYFFLSYPNYIGKGDADRKTAKNMT